MQRLGATDQEISEFFALNPSEDDWIKACFGLIKQDRRGVIAARKGKRSQWRRKFMKENPSHRVRNAAAARIWAALKGRTDGALFSRLEYSKEALVEHLERQFKDGMSWENYGAWHVDHIKPCAAFDLVDEGQFAECWALANLRPLWAAENIKKGAKIGAA